MARGRTATGVPNVPIEATPTAMTMPLVADVTLRSALAASLAVGAGIVPAVLVANWLARGRSWLRFIVDVVINVPLAVPPVVTGLMLLTLFGRRGPLAGVFEALGIDAVAFTFPACVIAAGVMAFPLMVRTLRVTFEWIDPAYAQAARVLGASRAGAWWRVELPMAMPGTGAALAIGFARAIGEFGATIVFAGNIVGRTQTLPTAIFDAVQTPAREAEMWTLAGIAVAVSVLALAVSEWLVRRARKREGLA